MAVNTKYMAFEDLLHAAFVADTHIHIYIYFEVYIIQIYFLNRPGSTVVKLNFYHLVDHTRVLLSFARGSTPSFSSLCNARPDLATPSFASCGYTKEATSARVW